MLVVGLTGGIAMGKSYVTRLLRAHGVPVFDADAAVHRLLGPGGGAVAAVAAAFPGTVRADGAIDRAALGQAVFADPLRLRQLEAILHPLVRDCERRFLAAAARARAPVAVLDIPLLFESGAARRVDRIVTVSTPRWLQEQRVLRRPGVDRAKLRGILARQASDAERRRGADHVIASGHDQGRMAQEIARLLRSWHGLDGAVWPTRWAAAVAMRPGRDNGCARSSSIPRPPGSIRSWATGSWRSPRSNWSTTCRPGAASTAT